MALHAHTSKPNTAIFTDVFVVSSPWPTNDKPSLFQCKNNITTC